MKVALIIGHNKRARGAYSQILGREYDYWKGIAEKIKTEIPELVDVYERKPNEYYTREMFEVLEELNKNNYKFCIELHFNAAESEQANGCECLVYYKNNKAKELATNFMARLQNKFGSKIRTKENILKDSEVRNRGKYARIIACMKGKEKLWEGRFILASSALDKEGLNWSNMCIRNIRM